MTSMVYARSNVGRKAMHPSFATALGVCKRLPYVSSVTRFRRMLRRRILSAVYAAVRWWLPSQSIRMDLQAEKEPLVACGGGGVFFFWQLGAARAVLEARHHRRRRAKDCHDTERQSGNEHHHNSHHDDGVVWAGSSAGALCAVLTTCGVDPREAVKVANTLAENAGVYGRPFGLAGVWGGLIREWLEILLPDDAAELCSGKVAVHVTVWKGYWKGVGVERICSFEDRDSLLSALMASVHIPWFLDGRMWSRLVIGGRLRLVMDGSVISFLPLKRLFGVRDEDLEITIEPGREADYLISHIDDFEYMVSGPAFTELIGVNAALAMVERGYSFTLARLEDNDVGWKPEALGLEDGTVVKDSTG